MALAPRPKARSQNRVDLQQGERPRLAKDIQNPEDVLGPSNYHRAAVMGSAGAMPSETYQYDIVYQTFLDDEEFKRHWQVVGSARNSPLESISQDNASIRVVMDLPSSQKLVPTAYTPGFPTVPFSQDGVSAHQRQHIAGLPPGYSVALDVHILEDARIMLAHQRAFRNGKIDQKYEWLDDIVRRVDESNPQSAIADASARRGREEGARRPNLVSAEESGRPEAQLRKPIGSLPMDCSVPGLSEELRPFSDLYGEREPVMRHVCLGPSQVYAESSLVSAFGNQSGLPKRDNGQWATSTGRSREAQDKEARDLAESDRRLEDLLNRTLERPDPDDPYARG